MHVVCKSVALVVYAQVHPKHFKAASMVSVYDIVFWIQSRAGNDTRWLLTAKQRQGALETLSCHGGLLDVERQDIPKLPTHNIMSGLPGREGQRLSVGHVGRLSRGPPDTCMQWLQAGDF